MMYQTTQGRSFGFSGWQDGDSPLDHFDARRWLECAHGVCLALSRHHDVNCAALAVEDDGLLHELIHLSLGVDICTHHVIDDLRRELTLLMNEFEEMMGRARAVEGDRF